MQEKSCTHLWEMTNKKPGFIVSESCFKCKKTATYFSLEEKPPIEEYKDGEHFWNVSGHAQSIRFDLQCKKCGKLVKMDELAGLMMCSACEDNCKAYSLMQELEKDRTWVYLAFGFLPFDEKKQLNEEQISILEDYFNQRRKSSTSKIKILPGHLIDNFSICYGDIINDVDMLVSKPPKN